MAFLAVTFLLWASITLSAETGRDVCGHRVACVTFLKRNNSMARGMELPSTSPLVRRHLLMFSEGASSSPPCSHCPMQASPTVLVPATHSQPAATPGEGGVSFPKLMSFAWVLACSCMCDGGPLPSSSVLLILFILHDITRHPSGRPPAVLIWMGAPFWILLASIATLFHT